jgi:GDP-4-dehydro-6-deoxy-D-mannose reductase
MSRPILVTGAAGFGGGHLLDLLSRDTSPVVGWRRPGGAPQRDVPGVRWQEVDLLDRPAVAAALAALKPAAVYHCAGAAHAGRSWDTTESTLATNVRGTHHLIEGLREAGGDARVLIPSSAMVYAPIAEPLTEDHPLRPNNPYGWSKLAQELVGGNNDGMPRVYIARPFNHMGPRQDPAFAASGFARRIADIEAGRWAPEIAVGNLEARRDLTDVRDTVRAYRAILESGAPGRPYNVCSGRAIAIGEVLDLLLARARVRIAVVVDAARYRPNDQPLVVGDPTRIHTELQWTPEIPIEQTVDDLLDYWRTRTEGGAA